VNLDVNPTDYSVNTIKMMLDMLSVNEFYTQHRFRSV